MTERYIAASGAVTASLIVIAVLFPSPAPAFGQVPSSAAETWNLPRTPDGQPDLQGNWNSSTVTPLERPAELAQKQFFTELEAAAYEKQYLEETNRDRRDPSPEIDLRAAYNQFWYERGTEVVSTGRTSLIVDPPDGRIPSLTPDAQNRADTRAEARRLHPADGPEDLPLNVRCILWSAGPPMLPGPYNNNYQIVQTPGYVVILIEMIHDARIIPLDGRPHLPDNIRQWMGDSRGRWEGDTLIVETTNFTDKTNFRGASDKMRVVERFTRTDEETLLYDFTIDDPSSFTRPWTGQIPMKKSDGLIYEYACHEANHGLAGILSGARAEDNAAEEAANQ